MNPNTPQIVTVFIIKNNFLYVKVGASWFQCSGVLFPTQDPYIQPVIPTPLTKKLEDE